MITCSSLARPPSLSCAWILLSRFIYERCQMPLLGGSQCSISLTDLSGATHYSGFIANRNNLTRLL
uniref:Uncharacterized protein n=1 Tax=Rhizophora mucronata TaxID=61149 RepID=A0A2P2QFM0_RHIMU